MYNLVQCDFKEVNEDDVGSVSNLKSLVSLKNCQIFSTPRGNITQWTGHKIYLVCPEIYHLFEQKGQTG